MLEVENEIDTIANAKRQWEIERELQRQRRQQRSQELDQTKEAARTAMASRRNAAEFFIRSEKTLMMQRQRQRDRDMSRKGLEEKKWALDVEQDRRDTWEQLRHTRNLFAQNIIGNA